MEDREIVSLFLARREEAIAELSQKYGSYCSAIAYRILDNRQDAEEILDDCYLRVWNAIPPDRPDPLAPYVGAICRRLAISRAQAERAEKRGGGRLSVLLDELESALPDRSESDLEEGVALRDLLERFLRELPIRQRRIFLQRYWYFCPIDEIAERFDMKSNSVSVMLMRTRKKLKTYLEKEGFSI